MIDPKVYQWLRIEPVDAWFFRDGRPSNRGEDQSDLESEFPPNATSVVGALRAALARANGWSGRGSWADESRELTEVLGNGFNVLGKLSFLGPFLCKRSHETRGTPREELLWPLPQHVVGRLLEGRFVPESLLEPSREQVCCDVNPSGARLAGIQWRTSGNGHAHVDRRLSAHPERIFVTTTGLSQILSGNLPAADECIPAHKLFVHESRVGILREVESRTTGRNALCSPRFVRLENGVSLVQAIAGIPGNWKLPTLMAFGGESRMGTIDRLRSNPGLPLTANIKEAVAIALTPARFGVDWWGAGPGDPAANLSSHLSGNVRCVALDRPRLIGGWDFEAYGPRPLVPFAPAGTVWWLDGNAAGNTCLVHLGTGNAYGYGLAVVSAELHEKAV